MPGLMGLACSGSMITERENVKEKDEFIAIGEVPVVDGTIAGIAEPETNLS